MHPLSPHGMEEVRSSILLSSTNGSPGHGVGGKHLCRVRDDGPGLCRVLVGQLIGRDLQEAGDDYLEMLASLDGQELCTKDDALDVSVEAN